MVDAIRRLRPRLAATLTAGVQVSILTDLTDGIRASVHEVEIDRIVVPGIRRHQRRCAAARGGAERAVQREAAIARYRKLLGDGRGVTLRFVHMNIGCDPRRPPRRARCHSRARAVVGCRNTLQLRCSAHGTAALTSTVIALRLTQRIATRKGQP
ncbi:MAG TPA: hypothetical protein VF469_33730 [Kofleriaceae bacterium]